MCSTGSSNYRATRAWIRKKRSGARQTTTTSTSPRYIDSSEPEDLHDLDAHLNGGIPNRDIDALDAYWKVFPSLRADLFKENGRPGYSDARVETREVKASILAHDEFKTYAARVTAVFE